MAHQWLKARTPGMQQDNCASCPDPSSLLYSGQWGLRMVLACRSTMFHSYAVYRTGHTKPGSSFLQTRDSVEQSGWVTLGGA